MYLTIKLIHIISATLMFGTGLGSAFYMYMTYRSGDISAMAQTNRIVVIADSIFTAPMVIVQLVTGLFLLNANGMSWNSTWSLYVLAMYLFVGACWLPVVWLQIRLRDRACELKQADESYIKMMRIWLTLGAMAFPAVVILYAFMVFKPFWGQA